MESYLLEHEAILRVSAFLLVLAAMAAWERGAPARAPASPWWGRWRTNLGLAVANSLLLRVALPTSAIGLAGFAQTNGWGLLNHYEFVGWVALVATVVALDFVIYLQHVLFHAVPALARLHQVHHADPDFDTTTGIRFHPIEILLSMLIKFAAIVAIGAAPLAVLVFELMLNLSSLFNHGNVRIPAPFEGPVRALLVTPDMHRVHHSVVAAERDSNYGFCLSVWDRLFGTYVPEPAGGHVALTIGFPGLSDPSVSTTFLGVLGIPFRATAPSGDGR